MTDGVECSNFHCWRASPRAILRQVLMAAQQDSLTACSGEPFSRTESPKRAVWRLNKATWELSKRNSTQNALRSSYARTGIQRNTPLLGVLKAKSWRMKSLEALKAFLLFHISHILALKAHCRQFSARAATESAQLYNEATPLAQVKAVRCYAGNTETSRTNRAIFIGNLIKMYICSTSVKLHFTGWQLEDVGESYQKIELWYKENLSHRQECWVYSVSFQISQNVLPHSFFDHVSSIPVCSLCCLEGFGSSWKPMFFKGWECCHRRCPAATLFIARKMHFVSRNSGDFAPSNLTFGLNDWSSMCFRKKIRALCMPFNFEYSREASHRLWQLCQKIKEAQADWCLFKYLRLEVGSWQILFSVPPNLP